LLTSHNVPHNDHTYEVEVEEDKVTVLHRKFFVILFHTLVCEYTQ